MFCLTTSDISVVLYRHDVGGPLVDAHYTMRRAKGAHA